MRILIVEDQENLARLIKKGLKSEGLTADYVLDGEAGQKRIDAHHQEYDLILLDLMMPKKNGIEVCKSTRDNKITTPILMLTARDGVDDIIKGLNAGADDYLIKPFSFDELLARIRAILRRPKTSLPAELKARDIVLNPATKKVFRGKKEIKLTLKEFSLLEYLMRNPNQVIGREQILSSVWDFSFDSFANVVDVHMANLRKKINVKSGGHKNIIETVRGLGYRLNA